MQDLRNALQSKIRRLPVRYFDSHQFGDVLSRITNDVDAISNALQQSFVNVVTGVLTIILALIMMFRHPCSHGMHRLYDHSVILVDYRLYRKAFPETLLRRSRMHSAH